MSIRDVVQNNLQWLLHRLENAEKHLLHKQLARADTTTGTTRTAPAGETT
jgi:hypothetical protein